ncbi:MULTISPECIES: hypothetical protein [Moorena]|uniref:Uncharacterized protein n=1 Tax=Moorena producens 3L TaxID=489825 RepID=F4XXV3_9CYAN|nr:MULTISPECIES: hypothetical protein [Moorena]EGJ30606.1 hypothetical protein LYNGBM3L_48960 [Moorena producens 3L]NEP32639.1 hypothetical protein [Moorena sp. SIO3B2]NEP68303.1 hypothetical protein [Moorena sp. SIO3A5]NES39924.1 hypothetical protein [Moorena sp. SIO2C4]OLT68832.1 hypothetical protein BI334_30890 [Moorena producens 3L]
MKNKVIDVTDLSPKQIAMLEEIIAAFKAVSQQNIFSQDISEKEDKEKEDLKQLHQEFDWLVADLGVKEPLTRSNVYGIE